MKDYDVAEVAEKIMDEIQKELRELDRLNIVILGKTGAGKSTLINNLFGQKMAETGIGRPVTQSIRKIRKADFPLTLFDTPGLELAGEHSVDNLLSEVTKLIEDQLAENDIGEAIHCILYCVNTASHRIEPAEIEFLRRFSEEKMSVPVIIVLTQAFSKKEARKLREKIESENLPVFGIVPVLAEDYIIDEEYAVRAYGLTALAEMIDQAIPEAIKKTFVHVQIADIHLKQSRAQQVINKAALTAAAVGAVPIPVPDATILVPTQISMLAKITNIFGLTVEKASITGVLAATIGTTGTTVLGRNIVKSLTLLIPGVGTVAGGAISAGTAAALTAALGEAYVIVLTQVLRGDLSMEDLGTPKGMDEIRQIFMDRLRIHRKKDGQPENQENKDNQEK